MTSQGLIRPCESIYNLVYTCFVQMLPKSAYTTGNCLHFERQEIKSASTFRARPFVYLKVCYLLCFRYITRQNWKTVFLLNTSLSNIRLSWIMLWSYITWWHKYLRSTRPLSNNLISEADFLISAEFIISWRYQLQQSVAW